MTTSQTAVFRHVVRDHMVPPPVIVPATLPAVDVVRRMAEARASAAVVTEADGRLAGIFTEQDVVRRHAGGDLAIGAIMTAPVLTVAADELLYRAVGFMRRNRLRHMPVVAAEGSVVGMLELHQALAVAAGPMVEDIDRLTHEDSMAGLAEVKAAQVRLAERLLADAVPAPEIQALIADVNNDIHRRVLDLLVAELGPPPVAFCGIVMGSGGRGESLLFPDQDNGFLLADYPDERHGDIDPWFVALAERFTTALDRLRFPLCKGGVMATNPVWRKTLPQWREQLAIWMRGRVPEMLLSCEIFLDFRCVWGERALAEELRRHVTAAARGNRAFLMRMLDLQAEHRVGLGLFGRLRTERRDPVHRGEIDLKLHGTLPLVEAVRLLALAHGVPVTGTLERIGALRAQGALNADDADHLGAAFALLTGLQLRQQLADHCAGDLPGNFVDPRTLTERERDLLRSGLRAIDEFRARLRADLTGALL